MHSICHVNAAPRKIGADNICQFKLCITRSNQPAFLSRQIWVLRGSDVHKKNTSASKLSICHEIPTYRTYRPQHAENKKSQQLSPNPKEDERTVAPVKTHIEFHTTTLHIRAQLVTLHGTRGSSTVDKDQNMDKNLAKNKNFASNLLNIITQMAWRGTRP